MLKRRLWGRMVAFGMMAAVLAGWPGRAGAQGEGMSIDGDARVSGNVVVGGGRIMRQGGAPALGFDDAGTSLSGSLKLGSVTRLGSNGASTLTLATVDNLRLDGNTLSSINTNGNIALMPSGTGKVGVGTVTPTCLLDVTGASFSTPNMVVSGLTGSGNSGIIGLNRSSSGRDAAIQLFTASTLDWHIGTAYNAGAPEYGLAISTDHTKANAKLYITKTGNVGIGSTAPQAPLHVVGDVTASGGIYTGGTSSVKGTLRIDANGVGLFTGLGVNGANPVIGVNADTIYGQPGYIWKVGDSVRASLFLDAVGTMGQLRLGRYDAGSFAGSCLDVNMDNGNIGIGTAAPQTRLHVDGNATLTGGLYTGGNASTMGSLRVDASGNAWFNTTNASTIDASDITADAIHIGNYGVIEPQAKAGDNQTTDRLTIQVNDASKAVAMVGRDTTGARFGLGVFPNSKIVAGNVDLVAPKEEFQLGGAWPMTFHEGGGNGKPTIFFNGYNDGGTNRYYGCLTDNSAVAAGAIEFDLGGKLNLSVVPAGQAGSAFPAHPSGITIDERGRVGIGLGRSGIAGPDTTGETGTTTATNALDVNGRILLRNLSNPSTVGGRLWADGGRITASDSYGDKTITSPHSDPREVAPAAQTSFADPAVVLPFSMHHENAYIGKGEVVDMSKMVAYIEKKMQAELGAEAGRLVFVYDLPAERRKSVQDYEVDAVLERLSAMGPVKVALGESRKLPAEALEEVDETVEETHLVDVPEDIIDFKTQCVITVYHQQQVSRSVPTGRKTTRLKKGWRLMGGEIYRPPALSDVDLDAVAKSHPQLPQWVLERIKSGAASSQSVSSLIEELKSRLAEARPATATPQELASRAAR